MSKGKVIDPLTVSIIEQRLSSITDEIGARTMKSCYSFATAHIRDLGIALYDKEERIIAHGDWMPVHVAGSEIALKGMLDYIGRDNIYQDDFIIGNDNFIVRYGHLPDWSFVRPVFHKGKLEFYTYMRTHQYDSGGAFPVTYFPRAYDIHAEGLVIPPIKIIERGKVNETIYDFLLHNVRGAPMVRMDNMLIYASMKKAEERLIEICDDYGIDVVRAASDEIIRSTEKSVREAISKWPSGTYRSERASDSDGTRPEPVWVRLALTIKPETGELIFDYSDSDKQVDFINSPLGNTHAVTIAGVCWCLPSSIPRNQGLYNCIKIKVKEGTVLDPMYPATTGAQACSLGEQIIECVLAALGQAIPKDTPALWTRHLCPIFTGRNRSVIDPRDGNPRMYLTGAFHSDGSAGAIYGYDGWNGIGPPQGAGAMLKPPIEIEEACIPWRWLCFQAITDSSGHGQFRGGVGTHCEYLNEHRPETYKAGDSMVQTGNSNGEKFGSAGLMGGTGGKKSRMWIKRRGKTGVLHTLDIVQSQPGDVIITESGGSGAVGSPVDREVDKVRWDVLNEYISAETARKIYKVVIDPKTFEVNHEATSKLRKRIKPR